MLSFMQPVSASSMKKSERQVEEREEREGEGGDGREGEELRREQSSVGSVTPVGICFVFFSCENFEIFGGRSKSFFGEVSPSLVFGVSDTSGSRSGDFDLLD